MPHFDVQSVRSEYQRAYELEHCNPRCRRYTPCLMVDAQAAPINERQYCATADFTFMHRWHRCRHNPWTPGDQERLARAANASWRDATLRITGPVADGFWVRALVVLSQVQWAQHAGLRQYSVAYSSPADAYDINNGLAPAERRPRR